MVETGRYKDIPLEERVCQMCNTGAVEDEEHFIGTCKKLKSVRDTYKGKFSQHGLDISQVNMLCIKQMLSPTHVKMTSDMLLELFELRKSLMYKIIHN